MFVTTLTFNKFAHAILVHWHILSIECKMTCEQPMSNKQKSMDNTHKYGACKCQLKLSCTVIAFTFQYYNKVIPLIHLLGS